MNDGLPTSQPSPRVPLLDAATVSTTLTNGVAATVASEAVDDFGSVTWLLQLTNTAGTRATRQITATHNGTAGADATTATWTSTGQGDLSTWTIAADLSGTGASQVMRLRVTAPGTGWTASVTRAYHKAP